MRVMDIYPVHCTWQFCTSTAATLVRVHPAPRPRWLPTNEGGVLIPPEREQGADYRCTDKRHPFEAPFPPPA
ncbi:hypothetical protein L603_004600000220 [Cellulosimicrobium cellulans J34]|nr:hypothetical protein L603_004600000220 [Cellulosimicrobium cellulans J34]SMF46853.1 hypothetical protein SAMN02744115_03466 [Cellulosimicrobium cellulans J1]